ncbi:Gelsolin [Hypsizygus marmoreus]|uniref:Gelsolin n=1 Tax=Hypsizygus marmoreus TaxID=39966 RepID=A0A369JSF5_HYPMA|nr:Gelsolin [Hypsizygus marmoreus]
MEARPSATRSRTSIPDYKPEAGLAEWTSKIKALQRQVDADEETEQRNLEEEIAAARLARLRRSHGASSRGSVDLSKLRDDLGGPSQTGSDVTVVETTKTTAERQTNHADTLRKLTGYPSPSTSMAGLPSSVEDMTPKPPLSRPAVDPKPQGISLAAFMGGRATGPRLNKHAPQQDAHDPTQFVQPSHDRAPHPIFGTGGVAMPGLASHKNGFVSAQPSVGFPKPNAPVSEVPPASKYSETYVSKSSSSRGPDVRERTISTPSVPSSSTSWPARRQSKPPSPVPPIMRTSASLTSEVVKPKQDRGTYMRSPTLSFPTPASAISPTMKTSISLTNEVVKPKQDRDTYTRSITPSHSKPADWPVTPRQQSPAIPMPSPKSSITTPSLARPIRPDPRLSLGPQIPSSEVPSKAFLRPPSQKEPTPSLSRLQGRGFVQNMVKVSTQLESPPVSAENTPEKSKPSGARRTSVLDRWQPNVSSNTSSPPPSPTPRAIRKSFTVDPFSAPAEKKSSRSASPTRTLKGATSFPSLRQKETASPISISRPAPEPKSAENEPPEALGSATTLIIVKPAPVDPPSVDELGFKHQVVPKGGKDAGFIQLPARTRTPLSHPTKERARKPRKHKDTESDAHASSVPSIAVSGPPNPSVRPAPLAASNGARRETSAVSPLHNPVEDTPRGLPTVLQTPSPTFPLDQPKSPVLRQQFPDVLASKHVADNESNRKQIPQPGEGVQRTTNKLLRRALPGMVTPGQLNGNTSEHKPASQAASEVERTNHGFTRRALPGLVATGQATEEAIDSKPFPSPTLPVVHPKPAEQCEEPGIIQVPPKHPRIPSTGNRATVMDVAQALSESEGLRDVKVVPGVSDSQKPAPAAIPRALALPAYAEKRKSSYEKYSAIILPPLKEEVTPTPSPAATLSRKEGEAHARVFGNGASDVSKPYGKEHRIQDSVAPSQQTSETISKTRVTDVPPPGFSIDNLLNAYQKPALSEPGITTISVDVMAITGTTATAIKQKQAIFYDTEILAIIYRSKSQSSGLVSTAVWGWEGKRATLGEREQRKLQDLAKRYSTIANIVHQNSEPLQLVHVLGGVLAIRQGSRTHWTPENTAMHLVRSQGGVILVDEKDLSIRNLCSAFSYCVSILDSVYVWYGRGSISEERRAALEYARSLTTNVPPIELSEDDGDDDEMFWMILGDEEFANADYWQWRRTSTIIDPRIWRINASLGKDCITPTEYISNETSLHDSVYIIDCVWELYVLVGCNARGQRKDIGLALWIASELSARVSPTRPYPPTVHALVLPSQLPRDLRLIFRDLDEFTVNNGEIPDHMNILSSAEALIHLQKTYWDKHALQDHTMLPLGIDTSDFN